MSDVVHLPLFGRLGVGKVALIDADLLPLVSGRRWFLYEGPTGQQYVRTFLYLGKGRRKGLFLHRVAASHIEGMVDHINGDTLDCRRDNLRPATPAQNAYNAKKKRVTASRFKGVLRQEKSTNKPWAARIVVDGKKLYLGGFPSEVEAARAYDTAARKYCGGYARLNFPVGAEQPALAKVEP